MINEKNNAELTELIKIFRGKEFQYLNFIKKFNSLIKNKYLEFVIFYKSHKNKTFLEIFNN